jgi:hypothetical protein
MTYRFSPQIMKMIGMCALLTGIAIPAQAQTYYDRRPSADIRRGNEELQQRRALESMRQSQDAQMRARAAEERQRELKRQSDQLSKPLRRDD